MGGFIDQTFPHSVNHIKLGNLGDFEILLMACDDGDVIAYYTHRKDDRVPVLSSLLLIRSCDIRKRNMLTSRPPSALEGDYPRFELYRSTSCRDPAVSITELLSTKPNYVQIFPRERWQNRLGYCYT